MPEGRCLATVLQGQIDDSGGYLLIIYLKSIIPLRFCMKNDFLGLDIEINLRGFVILFIEMIVVVVYAFYLLIKKCGIRGWVSEACLSRCVWIFCIFHNVFQFLMHFDLF